MIVFAGPSVPKDVRSLMVGIDWRPPAVAGDLLRLVAERPDRVLLIDGLFDEMASVKHKEAIALMETGTRLFGATSMGALRAAELAAFGMIPLGSIAKSYCRGHLVGDDEVALVHGDDRIGWQAVSVAMVDVRATLMQAMRRGLIDRKEAKAVRTRWHDIHFVDRDWPRMVAEAKGIVPTQTAERIAALHVPLKQRDAAGALQEALRTAKAPGGTPTLHKTLFYEKLVAGIIVPSGPQSRA